MAIAVVTYCGLSLIFPPRGLGVAEPWDTSPVVREAISKSGEASVMEEKGEHVSEVECLPAASNV
jgi:hypothetical protein